MSHRRGGQVRLFLLATIAALGVGLSSQDGSAESGACQEMVPGNAESVALCARSYEDSAAAHYDKDEDDLVLSDCEQAIALSPDRHACYFLRGSIRLKQGKLDGAITDFSRVIEIRPGGDKVFYNRGKAYARKGDAEHAIADISRAIELNPAVANYYYDRGGVYDDLGDHARAVADFDAAIRLVPDFMLAYVERGIALRAMGRVEEAIRDYGRAIEMNPGMAWVYNNRGNAYRDKGEYDRAIADYDLAIKLDATDARYFNNRAGAYAGKGEGDRAIADFSRAIELDPNYAVPYMDRGDQFNLKGEFAKAIADAEMGMRLEPADSMSWWVKGAAEFGLGRHQAAAVSLADYVAKEPGDAYGVLMLYLAQARAGQDGRDALRANAARLDPSLWPNPIIRHLLGELPEEKVSISINDPDTICDREFYLGQGLLLQGKAEEARNYLDLAAQDCRATLAERALAKAELKRL
jgi:tetratricopeptide (TPR) repeat protein